MALNIYINNSFEMDSLEMDQFAEGILVSFSDEIVASKIVLAENYKDCGGSIMNLGLGSCLKAKQVFLKDFEPPLHSICLKKAA